MFMDAPPPSATINDCFLEADRGSEEIRAVSDSGYDDLFEYFSFSQKVFVLDRGVFLRLNSPLTIRKMGTRNLFKIDSWGISISCDSISQLPNKICREFLKFNSKAQKEILVGREEETWMKIIDSIDYQSFSIESALPDYAEGKILRKDDARNRIYIEWHDGEREWVSLN